MVSKPFRADLSPSRSRRLSLPPDARLRCLLVHPGFASAGYWDYSTLCGLVGAKYSAAPLGLLTVAAILPQHWRFRLVDLNVRPLGEADWEWADLVCVGGKQPQQQSHLETIDEARRRGVFVVAGGPNPSAQPSLFSRADCLVIGEAENTIPIWLESWKQGRPAGVYRSDGFADVTASPTPRFDLIAPRDYLQLSIQYSRGCPHRCDFCDVPSQFGSALRVKTPEQVLAELQAIYDIGYRGPVDIADDNAISNRRAAKEQLLPSLIAWSREHGYPFWFSTEVSLDVAEDPELLRLMREADFRIVFVGIETSNEVLLRRAGKRQNLGTSLTERVRRLQSHGICVSSGFILGFDGERARADRSMIEFIEESAICMARPAVLIALPNTALTTRLIEQGRMRPDDAALVYDAKQRYRTGFAGEVDIVDQTAIGLNFDTERPKDEILEELKNVIRSLYEPAAYMARVRRAVRRLAGRQKHRPPPGLLAAYLRAFVVLSARMTRDPATRRPYWRTVLGMLVQGSGAIDHGLRLLLMYLHLGNYAQLAVEFIGRRQVYERAFLDGRRSALNDRRTDGHKLRAADSDLGLTGDHRR